MVAQSGSAALVDKASPLYPVQWWLWSVREQWYVTFFARLPSTLISFLTAIPSSKPMRSYNLLGLAPTIGPAFFAIWNPSVCCFWCDASLLRIHSTEALVFADVDPERVCVSRVYARATSALPVGALRDSADRKLSTAVIWLLSQASSARVWGMLACELFIAARLALCLKHRSLWGFCRLMVTVYAKLSQRWGAILSRQQSNQQGYVSHASNLVRVGFLPVSSRFQLGAHGDCGRFASSRSHTVCYAG